MIAARSTSAEPSPKRVGIWIRVSTEDQAKGESPEHHEIRAQSYAAARGWEVAAVYHLEGISGRVALRHPEADRMRSDIRSRRVTGLIFSKLARLARNTGELLELAEFFRASEADLVSIQEAIDTSSPSGRFFFTMLGAMGQWEREEASERVAASIPIRARLGKPLGGKPPMGYRFVDRKLVPDPETAPVRRLVYELFREHRRLKSVATVLNDAGYRSQRGNLFTDSTIEVLLEDPTPKGTKRANYSRSSTDRRAMVLKPETDWVYYEVEPIVSEELWNECQVILESRRRGKRPARKPQHLFTGVTFCSCGGRMHVPWQRPKYTCLDCRRKIPVEDLEGLFAEHLKHFFLDPGNLAGYLTESSRAVQEKEELLATLWRDRERLALESEKLYRLYLEEAIGSRAFAERNRPLESRLDEIDREIPRIQGEIASLTIQNLSGEELAAQGSNLWGSWETLAFEDRRAIVELLVERIDVAEGEVMITLHYRPTPTPSDKSAAFSQSTAGGTPPHARTGRRARSR